MKRLKTGYRNRISLVRGVSVTLTQTAWSKESSLRDLYSEPRSQRSKFILPRGEGLQKASAKKQTPWPESASYLYRTSDRRLSTKLVLTFEDFAWSARRIPTAVFSVSSLTRGCVDPVPDPLLLRKSGSAVNRTRDL
jgi:hypothetical protein